MRVKDFDMIWLNDIIDRIELEFKKHKAICQNPSNKGSKEFWTDYRPRKGGKLYRPDCRERFQKKVQEQISYHSDDTNVVKPNEYPPTGTLAKARINYIDEDHAYANSGHGLQYIFCLNSLEENME